MGQAICIRKDEKPLGYDWECGHEELYVRVNMYYNGSLYIGLWQEQKECEEKLELFGDLTIGVMLNEIIKTAEELNTAALYYRQSGNMDGVRELAKAHAVSKKQTEEFIQGSRYRLVDIPIEERKFANASEKLRAEMFALKDAGFADIIGQYLVNLAKTDSALDAQVLKKHKMLQRCLDYVTQKAYNIALEGAKKKGENGIRANTGLALSCDQVFPWVLEYYAKDDEKEIAEKEQEEKKKIQKEWDSVNKRTKTIPKNPGTKKDSEVHPKEAAEQEEKYISKKKSKDSGQMSLFDMMQSKES